MGGTPMLQVDVPFPPGDDLGVKQMNAFIAVCLIALLPCIARAQSTASPGDALHVYLITLGPGTDPWEKFGHDFIDVEDSSGQLLQYVDSHGNMIPPQMSFNWGVFDFGKGFSGIATFGGHFLQGKLVYSMRSTPTAPMVAEYVAEGRYILKQELQLTAKQKLELLFRLQENDTDANRYYLYDYFIKNCSTMTRDAIDKTVDGRVHDSLSKIPTVTTLRWQSLRCTADTPWLYVFLDYALGRPTDKPLSQWEESFIPLNLAGHLREVKVPGPIGQLVPFVKSEEVLSMGTFPIRQLPPANFIYGFLGTGVGYGAVLAALAFFGSRSKFARWGFKFLAVIWSLVAGVLGLLLTLAWLTDHEAAKWNENWFQVNLLSLLLVVLIPGTRRWPNAARNVALVVLGLSAFDLLAKLTPWFYQVNGSIIAVALPIHAAVAWGILRMPVRGKTQEPIEAKSHGEALPAV
jgi:hypothetical protein